MLQITCSKKTKLLSGGEYTLNAIADKANVNVTKGDLKVYTYKGDSGTLPHFPSIAPKFFSA